MRKFLGDEIKYNLGIFMDFLKMIFPMKMVSLQIKVEDGH